MTSLLRPLSSHTWLIELASRPEAGSRLFCFPHAGGSGQLFRRWADGSLDAEIWGVELPGRGARLRHAPVTDLDTVVEAVATELKPLLDRPFSFFGHSVGALVAFETARRLRARQEPIPQRLIVSAHRAPHLPLSRAPAHALPDGRLISVLGELGGTPQEVIADDELMAVVLPALRADMAISETYLHTEEPPLACSISALGGLQDRNVTRAELSAWRLHAGAEFSIRFYGDDHFFIESERDAVLRNISYDLGIA